jgi:hypothetical protein
MTTPAVTVDRTVRVAVIDYEPDALEGPWCALEQAHCGAFAELRYNGKLWCIAHLGQAIIERL